MWNKKGQAMSAIGAMAVGIATLAIVLSVAFLVMANVQDQIVDIDDINESSPAGSGGTWTTAYNATMTMQEATEDVPGWVPLVVIVAIGSVILGMIQVFKR